MSRCRICYPNICTIYSEIILYRTTAKVCSTRWVRYEEDDRVMILRGENYTPNGWNLLTPPHPKARARSFPVPKGRTAIGGIGVNSILSSTDKIQPTVPSPPQAKIRKFGTFRNNSSLKTSERYEMNKLYNSEKY